MTIVLDLVDDHCAARVLRRNAIGVVLYPNALPVLVACFVPGGFQPTDYYSLNRVGEGPFDDPAPRLSRHSVITVAGAQLEVLHREGEIQVGGALVRLLHSGDPA